MHVDNPPSPDDSFAIVQPEMDWLRQAFWESVFSLSNGLLGTRGSFEEPMPGTPSRPMTFMAGLYDTLPRGLPELPILPDWLTTQITLAGSRFDLRRGRTRQFTRWLDMRQGWLGRDVVWQDGQGRETQIRFRRFLSMADRLLGVVRIEITPVNWSGEIAVKAELAMPPVPPGRGRPSSRTHWRSARLRSSRDGVCWLRTRTRQTRRPLAVAGAYGWHGGGRQGSGPAADVNAKAGESYVFDRFVVFAVGEPDAEAPAGQARQVAASARLEGFDALVGRHAAACAEMWDRMDVEIDGPIEDQRAVRFNLFQLATLCPRPGDVASIGPKGLSGTNYLGHVFWDTEIYMLPMLALTNPQGARTLLTYRYETLDGARRKARATGYRGARYAWESADTGEETCPRYLPDPKTGEPIRIWCGDLQDHISADVPYAIDRYVRATGDEAFLWDCGAEIAFETAHFWASRVTRNDEGKYEIRDTMGPDEFHVHVNNDAYTNYLAHWNLVAAAGLYDNDSFPTARREALIARLDLQPEEPAAWREIAANLVLPYDDTTGFVNQCDGFADRPDISFDIFRIPRRGPITDLIGAGLAIEGQVLKQAEVVILQCLLEDRFDRASREFNFDYYEPRTSHDSSLSVSAHALAAARLGRAEQAYDYFRRAACLDLEDWAGNTAAGLHTANMGGVWLAIAFGFAGLSIDGDEPTVEPSLPPAWRRLRFHIVHRGQRYVVDCEPGGGRVVTR